MLKIIVSGAKGRMGVRICSLIEKAADMELYAQIDKGDSLEKMTGSADVIVDFTVAPSAAENAAIAAKNKVPIVIGTTGLEKREQGIVDEAAKVIPIVMAPNMSVGVNVMWKLIEIAVRGLGEKFKIDIEETHHIRKLDKPSGTAKKILDIVLKESELKTKDDITIRSIREGEVVGDHVIHFTNAGEILTIEHHANNRDIFAEGALIAARWVVGKPVGLYGMDDVLGL